MKKKTDDLANFYAIFKKKHHLVAFLYIIHKKPIFRISIPCGPMARRSPTISFRNVCLVTAKDSRFDPWQGRNLFNISYSVLMITEYEQYSRYSPLSLFIDTFFLFNDLGQIPYQDGVMSSMNWPARLRHKVHCNPCSIAY